MPAGVFDCHHLEVIVQVPVLKPTIHYWVSKEKPHFLVRHRGKKDPFAPSQVTALVQYEHTIDKGHDD